MRFAGYPKELHAVALQGDEREKSFYPALADMFNGVAKAQGRKDVHVTTLPKHIDAGNPDFRLWNGTDRIIDYVEAKKPTEERLDSIEQSEQLKRYRSTFPNLILTNFLEFRLYRNGERIETVIGGCQVCEKWLKDRQERRLDLDDIRTYCRIVTALGLTIDIQKRIDSLYPAVERSIVAITGDTP